jgi:hypothetical protein
MRWDKDRDRRAASHLLPWGAGMSVLLVLGGCGSAEESATAKRNAAAAPSTTVQSPDADLVAAVQAPGGTAPVSLRFELPQRPEPGVSFKLRLKVTANQALEKMQVAVEATPGIVLTDPSAGLALGKTAQGASGEVTLAASAQKEGVYELRATVVAEGEKGDQTQSVFSIPVMVVAPPAT